MSHNYDRNMNKTPTSKPKCKSVSWKDDDGDEESPVLLMHRRTRGTSAEHVSKSKITGHNGNEEVESTEASEIEQLRYRISQLEHLIAMPPAPAIHHTTSTNTYNYASISIQPGNVVPVPFPHHSSAIEASTPNMNTSAIAQLGRRQKTQSPVAPESPGGGFHEISSIAPTYEMLPLLHRVGQLEILLSASEVDNRKVKEELELLTVAKNHERMELQEKLKMKDLEIHTLQEKLTLAEIYDAKNAKKLAAVGDYINTLPSEEELNDLQNKVDSLTAENGYLSQRLADVKTELSNTQKQMIQKEHELQDALRKLEDLKPLEEAQQSLLKDTSLSLTVHEHDGSTTATSAPSLNETNVLNLVTLQKAQLIQSKKMIKALRTKLHARDDEKNELILTLANKVKSIGDLQEQLTYMQIENENTREREARLVATRNELDKKCEQLKATVEELKATQDSRKAAMVKLIQLSTQVELCCTELRQLTQLCQSICNGEEPSVEDLVGLGESVQTRHGTDADNDNLNLEWITQKCVDILKVRQDVQRLRTKINSLYTDTIAQDLEKCNVQ